MTTYKHQPDNPLANERGFVTAEDFYAYKYFKEDDKRAVIGNQTVELNFISDSMGDYTWHPADGKYYDSKSKFRQVTKAHGCIEVGNETKTLTKQRKQTKLSKKQRREDIKRAVWEIKNGQNTYHNTPYENVFKKK